MKPRTPLACISLSNVTLLGLGAGFFLGCSTHAAGDNYPDGVGPFDPVQTHEDASQSGTGTPGPADHGCKDQERRPCSQREDGAHIIFPKGQPIGACQYGEQVCENGSWQACKGLVAPKSKDRCNVAGDDSSCNGTPNEGCDCVDAQAPRPCGVSDIGICKMGVQSCENGSWGECKGDVPPKTELCDNKGIDEDCDGQVDLADDDCYCVDGEQKLCTTGLEGDCNLGIMTCTRGAWGECIPRFPRLERESCHAPRTDAHGSAVGDEDCDGQVDNTPRNGKEPTACQVYMIDEDKDGWGALGYDYGLGQDTYTFGCFCVGHVPHPAMVQDTLNQANRDCGDCALGGDLVIPDAEKSFAEPSICLQEVAWIGGAFDYNCNSAEQVKRPVLGKCVEENGICKSVQGDWVDVVPACGELGRRALNCASSTPPCVLLPSLESEIQECN